MRYSGVLSSAVLTLNLHFTDLAAGSVACRDLQGRSVESGYHYSPGPDACTLCVCDNGNPKWCKAVLCAQPQECKSFRVGNTCCEFICMDGTISGGVDGNGGGGGNIGDGSASGDMGLRLVASCVTAILSLLLIFFLIHRLRQRKIRGRQGRQLTDDQRSLGSMGYLERGGLSHSGPVDDMSCGGGYPLWKPPGNYFPRGEAPPPYEEAVAAARAEQAFLSSSPHALTPLNFPNTYLSVNHNTHPSVATVANSPIGLSVTSPNLSNNQAALSSHIVSSVNRPLSSPSTHSNSYQTVQNDSLSIGSYTSSTATNFNMGTNTYENLPPPSAPTINNASQHSTPSNTIVPLSSAHSTITKSYHHHTTLPRQGGAFTISSTLPTSGASSHRTIPRTLATSGSLRLRRDYTAHQSAAPLFDAPPRNISPENTPQSAPPTAPSIDHLIRTDAFYTDILVGPPSAPPMVEGQPPQTIPTTEKCDYKSNATSTEVNQGGSIESVACACSMQALPTLHDDADDYRSECENCKSANGSRYYLDNQDELVTSPHETMTLHRRPEETPLGATPQYYRTSLTLPTSTRQRTRSTGARENWFSSMPESSTESSDED